MIFSSMHFQYKNMITKQYIKDMVKCDKLNHMKKIEISEILSEFIE